MNTNNIDLKSIRSLSGLNFYIPDYQRGYRWSDSQAIQMLCDFQEFCKRIDNDNVRTGEYYCLQPIVVKEKSWIEKQEDSSEVTVNGYEVIDGQQRLTTLYIILKCLDSVCELLFPDFSLYTIKYETRQDFDSQKFLENINTTTAGANDFIDFYYMKLVFDGVSLWFKNNSSIRASIAKVLLEEKDDEEAEIDIAKNVRVIWYEAKDKNAASSIDIFTRLNIGKIPLTNAELIKALLLKRDNFVTTEASMKQLQIASEWNRMEQKLQDDSFWYFLYRSDNPFTYENRIEFLFDLMKDRTKDSEFYHTFNEFNIELDRLKSEKENGRKKFRNDQACIDKIWDEVKQVFQTLEEWYEDRTLYHFIGFLIEYKSDIKSLMNASTTMKKSDFLNNFIKTEISNKLGKIKVEELSFVDSKNSVKQVLLLFNILTALKDKKSDMRFPFNKYKKEKWDIEHVCSQTDRTVTDSKQRQKWIEDILDFFVGSSIKEDVNVYIEQLKEQISRIDSTNEIQDQARKAALISECKLVKEIDSLCKEDITDSEFDEAFKHVQIYFNENRVSDKDNISNLTLLDQETNRSYGNAFFPLKRKRIIQNDELGIFVPIATKNIFLKYYSNRSSNLMNWEESDAQDYLDNIKEFVSPYIKAGNEWNKQ